MAFPILAPALQMLDDNGNPLNGGKVFVYAPGTTTPKASYPSAADAEAGTSPNTNPVILDSAGRGQIWGADGESYKIVVQTSSGVVVDTTDNIEAPDTGSNSLRADLASTAESKGAALVGLHDSAAKYLADNVEDALAEIAARNKSFSRVASKLVEGANTVIYCLGDSLTYGYEVGGPDAGINGSTDARADYQYPESLQSALTACGFTTAVLNKGYPGDTTADALTRWPTASGGDVCILMYGTNDARDASGSPELSAAEYEANMVTLIEREINNDTFVILLKPPRMRTDAFVRDQYIRAYRATLDKLGERYGCPVIDVNDIVMHEGDIWSDGVHFNKLGYNSLGWNLAAYFSSYQFIPPKVAPGQMDLPSQTNLLLGSKNPETSSSSNNGYIWSLAQNEYVYLAADIQEDCYAVVTTLNSGAVARSVNIAVNGGSSRTGEVLDTHNLANDGSLFADRCIAYSPLLRRGPRLLFLSAPDADGAFIERIDFVSKDQAPIVVDREAPIKSPLSGVVLRDSAFAFNTALDRRRLQKRFKISAYVTLPEVAALSGIGFTTFDAKIATGFPSNFVLIARTTNTLRVRHYTGSASDTDFAAAFTTGVFDYWIDIEVDDNSLEVFVDGVSVGTATGFSAISADAVAMAMQATGGQVQVHTMFTS